MNKLQTHSSYSTIPATLLLCLTALLLCGCTSGGSANAGFYKQYSDPWHLLYIDDTQRYAITQASVAIHKNGDVVFVNENGVVCHQQIPAAQAALIISAWRAEIYNIAQARSREDERSVYFDSRHYTVRFAQPGEMSSELFFDDVGLQPEVKQSFDMLKNSILTLQAELNDDRKIQSIPDYVLEFLRQL